MNRMKKYYIAMAILAAVGLITVVWQYTISRGMVSDQRKVGDISELQSKLDGYYQDNAKLPANLSDLDLSDKLSKNLSDYEYSKTSNSFTLCANFKTDISDDTFGDDSPFYHGKGRQCFTQEVLKYDYNFEDLYDSSDPNLYNTEEYDLNTQDSLSQ